MASVTQAPEKSAVRRQAQAGNPPSSARFDLLMAGLSTVFLLGLFVDGWAHFHGKVDDSFFTVWHLVFYGAFGLCALALAAKQLGGVNAGHGFFRALPKGYLASLVGIVIFGVGGVGDMVWHTLFGIEGGTEALLSPTHILLGVGMALVFTGPARSAWARARAGENLTGWIALLPLLISATLLLTLLIFFTSYAHPMTMPLAQLALSGRGIPFDPQDFGVTAILLEAGVLAGIAGVLLMRFRLPFGALTLLAGVSSALLTVLVDSFVFLPGLFIALMIVDIVAYRLRPSKARPNAMIIVLTLLPALYYTSYFLTIDLALTVRWSIHVWTGSIALAAVVGALVGYGLTASSSSE
jgi:hypothetical protein